MTVIATAGHVDHGKSSLVRALTGTDPDRLAEEKQRGMTIELGFAHTTTPDGHTLSFIDVPGHVDFIRNMIAGVSHVGVVLLVIDAGEGWMPQTTEHCDVVALLGSKLFVVAISKCDRVNAERVRAVEADARKQLSDRGVKVAGVVATSAHSGDGIEQLRDLLAECVSNVSLVDQNLRMRLFIDRIFTMTGSGTVVTGTLQGSVSVGDHVVLARENTNVRVRAIQVHGDSVESATGPTRVALNIVGIAADDLIRGDVFIRADEWNVTYQCDVTVEALSSLTHKVNKRGQYMLHVGTSDQEAQLRVLGADAISPGHTGTVRLKFQNPLPLLPGDRFVLRETGRGETVGGGIVLDAHPVVSVSRARPDGSVQTYLRERGWMMVKDLWRDTGSVIDAIVDEWVATESEVETTRERLRALLDSSPEGIDVSILAPWEKSLVEQFDGVTISHGVARRGESLSPEEQRVGALISNGGLSGADTTQLPRDVIRRLVQQELVYEHDGIAFHVDVLQQLRGTLSNLWQQHPDGFTMAALRDATGLTRKHAVPLGTVLDKHGLTKRLGDVRMPGPRF
jgi:selenocysteine-specific elongation factor